LEVGDGSGIVGRGVGVRDGVGVGVRVGVGEVKSGLIVVFLMITPPQDKFCIRKNGVESTIAHFGIGRTVSIGPAHDHKIVYASIPVCMQTYVGNEPFAAFIDISVALVCFIVSELWLTTGKLAREFGDKKGGYTSVVGVVFH
jgi:hypothetical protein